MEYIADRITLSPDLCNGKPTVRGLRISVKTILGFLSAGESVKEILYQYPDLEQADIDACLKFATALMNRNYVIKDNDFSERIIFHSPPPRIIHIKFGNLKMKLFHKILSKNWDSICKLSETHKLVNVFENRIEGIN